MPFNKRYRKEIVLIAYFDFKNLALCNYGHTEYTIHYYSLPLLLQKIAFQFIA